MTLKELTEALVAKYPHDKNVADLIKVAEMQNEFIDTFSGHARKTTGLEA